VHLILLMSRTVRPERREREGGRQVGRDGRSAGYTYFSAQDELSTLM